MKQQGLDPIINQQIPTHRLGNNLDQIYTNMVCEEIRLADSDITDHKLIMVSMRLPI